MFKRPLLIIPILLLIIATILLIFVNISGASTGPLLDQLYWSRVTVTSGTVAWTNFRLCDLNSDTLVCDLSPQIAYPYVGLPIVEEFRDERSTFFYLTRVSYFLLLAGVLFTVISLLAIVISCICTVRVGSVFSSVFVGFTFFVTLAGASCVTAAHVKGVDAFNNDGFDSHIGVKMFAFVWSAISCQLLSFLALIGLARHTRKNIEREKMSVSPPPQEVTYA